MTDLNRPIYLDYNGTTPLDPEVIAAMRPFLDTEFGNASSSHYYGIAPKRALKTAREQMASLLNCSAGEIIFTSGGTESNNHAIQGTALARRAQGNHIVTDVIEHPAVLEVCRFLEAHHYSVSYLPVDGFGLVSPHAVAEAMRPDTTLITVMHSNNEIGTLQPIREIAEIARSRGVIMHTDAAQSVGKVRLDVKELGVDLLSIAGHKLYAPKGIGALYVRSGVELPKFMHGAGQESGRRAGTENILQIVGLGKACEIAARDFTVNVERMRTTRDSLEAALLSLPDTRINGHAEERLPNTLSVSFKGIAADRILEEIGLDVAASAGAACHSKGVTISHVLEAVGVPMEWAQGTLRFTTGKFTTAEEIQRASASVIAAVTRLRGR